MSKAPEGRALTLLVIRDGAFSTHALPERGTITVGRAKDNDVVIDDTALSRKHVAITTGEACFLEDLGSANGTRVRPAAPSVKASDEHEPTRKTDDRVRQLAPRERAAITPGDTILIGSATLVLQRAPAPKRATDVTKREVVVKDPAMERLYAIIDKVADSPVTVLLLGPTGAGKEVLAETIWRRSSRASKPLTRLNCASLSEALLESELFGHEKGAFTGANVQKVGLLESSSGGTVFLDEVGELPPSVQAKLLRVLEDKQVLRVGGVRPVTVDVRFIAATNRSLELEIERGRFRRDLFYRINGVTLTIPSLFERPSEIVPLAEAFIARFCEAAGRARVPSVSAEASDVLRAHPWPGNLRELRNAMERAVLLCEGDVIRPEHLPLAATATDASGGAAPPLELTDEERAERDRIAAALADCAGNQTHAAKKLNISRGTLVARLERYRLPRPRK